jgi:hypothetical protein
MEGYFVPMTKIADFLKAGVHVKILYLYYKWKTDLDWRTYMRFSII